MARFFASPLFQIFAIPLALMFLGVLANRLGRRDGDDTPRLNDWAIGTTLILIVLGIILGDATSFPQRLAENLAWLTGVLFAVFASLDHDRCRSWDRDRATGLPLKTKRLFVGIILPDISTLALFALFQFQKVSQ